MNAITLIAAILSFFLGGSEERVGNDKGQPIVVAKNEVSTPKTLPIPDLSFYNWTDSSFEIDDEWSPQLNIFNPDKFSATGGGDSGLKCKIVLDPPTECEIRFLLHDPKDNNFGKWSDTFKIKSGDFLDDKMKDNCKPGGENCEISFKGHVGQKVYLSIVAPVTFDISKKEFEKEIKFLRSPEQYSLPSGHRVGFSQVVEIPPGYGFEARLNTRLPLGGYYLTDMADMYGEGHSFGLGCGDSRKFVAVASDKRRLVFFHCSDDTSRVIVTITPNKKLLRQIEEAKLTSSAVAKKE